MNQPFRLTTRDCVMLVLLMAVTGCAWAVYIMLNQDVAFYLAAADRWLGGKALYRDIMDTNTPMVFMYSAAIDMIARLGTIDPIAVFYAFTTALLLCSLFLCFAIVSKEADDVFLQLLPAMALLLFFIPSYLLSFGQREHLFLAMTLPYLLMQKNVVLGKPTKGWIVYTAAVLAGVGVCFKPFFILFPLLVEAYLFVRVRAYRTLPKWPVFICLGIVAVYYLWMVLCTPVYFTTIFPLFWESYPYQSPFFLLQETLKILMIPTTLFCYTLCWLPKSALSNNDRVSLELCYVALISAACIMNAQRNDWDYHHIPLYFYAVLFCAVWGWTHFKVHTRIVYLLLALAWGVAGYAAYQPSMDRRAHTIEKTTVLNALVKKGQGIAYLGDNGDYFPAVNYSKVQWVLAFPFIMHEPGPWPGPWPNDPLTQFCVGQSVRDMEAGQPTIIIFSDDLLPYFAAYPAFWRFMHRHYTLSGTQILPEKLIYRAK